MSYIVTAIKSFIAILGAFMMTANGFATNEVTPFQAKREDILLNVTLISDTHTDSSEYLGQGNFSLGMENLKDSLTPIDSIVVAGDLTNYGDAESVEKFYQILTKSPVDVANIVTAVGNHEIGHARDLGITQDEARANFYRLTNQYLGMNIDKVYYSREVNGYRFIVLGDEAEKSWDWPEISQAQLDFLDSELAAATVENKPTFVVCHWPINDTNGQAVVWDDGGMGDYSDAVRAVLDKYSGKNVFYISGHLHEGLNSAIVTDLFDICNVETINGINYVNLPTYGLVNRYGIPWPATGFQMEIYEDEVLFRARNFATSAWYPNYDRSVELV